MLYCNIERVAASIMKSLGYHWCLQCVAIDHRMLSSLSLHSAWFGDVNSLSTCVINVVHLKVLPYKAVISSLLY